VDINPERLIGQLIKGALGGKRKTSRRAQRYLTGRGGLLNSRTLLALGGLAWGLYETATAQRGGTTPPAATGGGWTPGAPAGTPPAPLGAPPLPVPAVAPPEPRPLASWPPSPAAGAAPAAAPLVAPGVLRLIRLTLSAARADGTLTETERESILTQAREAGVEAMVAAELEAPLPLDQLVAGIEDADERADLYTLAFTIVRADESVNGAERIYLAQLAHRLGLSREDVERLEAEASERIDTAAGGADEDPAGKE
jgi:uncharacterized tellurite resistance protein B-like protein